MTSHDRPGFFRRLLTALGRVLPGLWKGTPVFPELEFEPVHGWTKPQRDDYLARNPNYRPAYEAQLRQHSATTTP